MTATLDLWPIGNCQVSALVDRAGRLFWGCLPRVDGDPAFCSLLDDAAPAADDAFGFWEIDLDGVVETTQRYLRNTAVLDTRHADGAGNAIEVIDFCPRYKRAARMYRPVAYARIVRPVAGSPRIRVRLRPATRWGQSQAATTRGSNHIRYLLHDCAMRLSTSAPVGWILDERLFRVEKPLHFFLGPDESFAQEIPGALEAMLDHTVDEWRHWVRGLATPYEWQEAVIRSAITLKLCQHEETGAIVAALTTSIPEHVDSGRTGTIATAGYATPITPCRRSTGWARSTCWRAISPTCATSSTIQPTATSSRCTAWAAKPGWKKGEATALPGYRGMGPVRVGNQAYEQVQHDAYGQIVLSNAQAFFDHRLLRMGGIEDFKALEPVGERAWQLFDQPDAGLWELRTKSHVHTYSAAMCWAACDRLGNVARVLGLADRADFWSDRARQMRSRIEQAAWRPQDNTLSATFAGSELDASLLQLLDLRFLSPDDPRFVGTLGAVEQGLRRGSYMLRYATEDDFGLPMTAFNVCTYWLIEALHFTGRHQDARVIFEEMLGRCTPAGLLSEDIDPVTGELWGNYPQTYSLVGLINCAVLLSKPWSAVR